MTALPAYPAEQLAELLAILPDVDSVELKLTIPDQQQRSVVHALEIDSLDAVIRQVAFIDTPDLRLSDSGVVVRARRTQHKPGDVTVKLRPMLPNDAPPHLRGHPGFKVEIDASPKGFTCSCSLTSEVGDHKVKKMMSGSRSVLDLLDDTQRALLLDRLPAGVGADDLTVLGTVHLLKCKFEPAAYSRRMVAELWMLPDDVRILELSTKATPAEAFQVAAETKVFLAGLGIDLAAPQAMKTQSALTALTSDPSPGDLRRSSSSISEE